MDVYQLVQEVKERYLCEVKPLLDLKCKMDICSRIIYNPKTGEVTHVYPPAIQKQLDILDGTIDQIKDKYLSEIEKLKNKYENY